MTSFICRESLPIQNPLAQRAVHFVVITGHILVLDGSEGRICFASGFQLHKYVDLGEIRRTRGDVLDAIWRTNDEGDKGR